MAQENDKPIIWGYRCKGCRENSEFWFDVDGYNKLEQFIVFYKVMRNAGLSSIEIYPKDDGWAAEKMLAFLDQHKTHVVHITNSEGDLHKPREMHTFLDVCVKRITLENGIALSVKEWSAQDRARLYFRIKFLDNKPYKILCWDLNAHAWRATRCQYKPESKKDLKDMYNTIKQHFSKEMGLSDDTILTPDKIAPYPW